jgi:hypothetical protein
LDWARAIDEIARLHQFIDLCLQSLALGREATANVELQRRAAHTLRKADPFPEESAYLEALERARILEQFAREENAHGFPFLYSLAIVRLWSILESMADEVLIALLEETETIQMPEILRRIQGSVVEFARSPRDTQFEFLASQLRSVVQASLKPGIGRFEAVFEPLGLGGPVPDNVRRLFMEMAQLRNVIVHRSAIADKRLVASSPWLGYAVGDAIRIQAQDFRLYVRASHWYALEIDRRFELRAGKALRPSLVELERTVIGEINGLLASRARGESPDGRASNRSEG